MSFLNVISTSNTTGGGGGATTFDALTDTNLVSLADKNILQYDSATSKWLNTDILAIGSTSYTDGSVLHNGSTALDWNLTNVLGVYNGIDYKGAGSLLFNQTNNDSGYTFRFKDASVLSKFQITDNLMTELFSTTTDETFIKNRLNIDGGLYLKDRITFDETLPYIIYQSNGQQRLEINNSTQLTKVFGGLAVSGYAGATKWFLDDSTATMNLYGIVSCGNNAGHQLFEQAVAQKGFRFKFQDADPLSSFKIEDGTQTAVFEFKADGTQAGLSLDKLDNINITAPTDGQELKYDNATSKWINYTPTAGGGSTGDWVFTNAGAKLSGQTNDCLELAQYNSNVNSNQLNITADITRWGNSNSPNMLQLDSLSTTSVILKAIGSVSNFEIQNPNTNAWLRLKAQTGNGGLVLEGSQLIMTNGAGFQYHMYNASHFWTSDVSSSGSNAYVFSTSRATVPIEALVIRGDGSVRITNSDTYMKRAYFTNHVEAPSYGFPSDTDTGLFQPSGADTLSLRTNNADRLTISNAGVVGIPQLTASSDVQTDGSSNLITVSDERLKRDIEPVDYGLNEIKKINPIRYCYKTDPEDAKPTVGFSAQNVLSAGIIEGAPINEDGFYGFNSRAVIASLVNAVKELSTRLEQLEQG